MNWLRRSLAALVVGLAAAGIAPAQNAPAQPAAVAVNKDYRINPEDVLLVAAPDIPALGRTECLVGLDGRIGVPVAGQLQAAGLTPAELEKAIVKELSKSYVKPRITVTLIRLRERAVSIIGPGQRQSGRIPLRDGWRVLDALATSGGLPTDRLEYYSADLLRANTGARIVLDLRKLLQDKNPEQNVLLEDRDILFINQVEEAKTYIAVTGAVNRPGRAQLPSDGSLRAVLAQVGPILPTALPSQAYVQRGDKKIQLDLRKLDSGEAIDFKFEMGDQLHVPENRRRYVIQGAISRPGEQLLPDDRRLTASEAIANAGVFVQNAALKDVKVVRTTPEGQTVVLAVNMDKILKKGDLSSDIELEPGDVVTVPATSNRNGFQNAQQYLWILSVTLGILNFLKRI